MYTLLKGRQSPAIIFGDSAYLAPRGDSTLIGTTREAVDFDTRVTLEGVEALRNTALRFVPALQQCDRETAWVQLWDMVDKSINLCKYTSGWFFRHEAVRTSHLSLD